jgi:hypothetical protein
MTCADMAHLTFLAAGDAALTRRAKKESGLSAVVVRFSRARKRYERQGILVEEAALDLAEKQCLADDDVRLRRRARDRVRRAEGDLDSQARLAAAITRLSAAARLTGPRRSPGTPASVAAAGSAGPPPARR